MKFPESPFTKYQKFGLHIDVSTICDPPPPEAINNLQQIWQRAAEVALKNAFLPERFTMFRAIAKFFRLSVTCSSGGLTMPAGP